MFAAERHGDYGPLIVGCFMVVLGAVLVLNVRGFARRMAQRVVDRFPVYERVGGVPLGYRVARLAGLVGVVVGIVIALLL